MRNTINKFFSILLILSSFFLLNPSLVSADIVSPTENIVNFTLNGKPYNKPVNFEIVCYGYSFSPIKFEKKLPGTYEPEEVYSWSAFCPTYGCKINKSHYLNYRQIDYCSLTGKTEGREFKIENIGTSPVQIQNCEGGMERVCTLGFEIPQTSTPIVRQIGVFKSFFEKIFCSIKKYFGKSC